MPLTFVLSDWKLIEFLSVFFFREIKTPNRARQLQNNHFQLSEILASELIGSRILIFRFIPLQKDNFIRFLDFCQIKHVRFWRERFFMSEDPSPLFVFILNSPNISYFSSVDEQGKAIDIFHLLFFFRYIVLICSYIQPCIFFLIVVIIFWLVCSAIISVQGLSYRGKKGEIKNIKILKVNKWKGEINSLDNMSTFKKKGEKGKEKKGKSKKDWTIYWKKIISLLCWNFKGIFSRMIFFF